jgi:uncharacterized protein (UPF0335 family)
VTDATRAPSERPAAALGEVMVAKVIARPPGQSDIEDGANLGTAVDNDVTVGGIAADRLRGIIERIERLEEERKALGNDIKDIYAEAKSAGFDVKVIREIIHLRKQEPAEVEEQESLLDLYRRALGM